MRNYGHLPFAQITLRGRSTADGPRARPAAAPHDAAAGLILMGKSLIQPRSALPIGADPKGQR